MPNLKAYLAADSGADPLQGNYVLTPLQDIILNFQGLSEQYDMMAFTAVAGADSAPALVTTGTLLQGDNVNGKYMGVAAGDFDGDGLAEIASVYNDNGALTLILARNQDPASSQSLSVVQTQTNIGSYGGGPVRVCAGTILNQPAATFCIAWADADSKLNVQVWHTDNKLKPTMVTSLAQTTLPATANLDIALGDFDQDGQDEIAVAWQGEADSAGNDLFLAIYDLETGNTLQAEPTVPIAKLGTANSFALAAGPFDSSSTAEQVAVAWSNAANQGSVCLYAYDSTNGMTACGVPYVDTTYPLTDSMLVRIAAGDLNFDGKEELVLGTVGQRTIEETTWTAAVVLHVLLPATGLQLELQSVGLAGTNANTAFAAVDFSLAIGQIGADAFSGIVVAALGTSGWEAINYIAQLNVGIAQVDVNLALPPEMVNGVGTPAGVQSFNSAQGAQWDFNLAMTLGDFSGQSLRVGPPTHYAFDLVHNIIAILNAPPTETNVNYNGSASLTFSDSQMESNSLGFTVNNDWTTSDQLGGSLNSVVHINKSMTKSYGENFSKMKDSSKSFNLTSQDTMWQDDKIILSGTPYDVWEYPVYNDTSGTPQGYLLVIFPDMDGLETFDPDGCSQFLDYFPDHQVGLAITYSPLPPTDYVTDASIGAPQPLDIGSSTASCTFSWTANTTRVKQQTQHTSLSISVGGNFAPSFNFLGGIGIGLQGSFHDTYMNSQASTQSVTYSGTTTLMLNYSALPDKSEEYLVSVYLYYSNQGGFLVVDYAVTLPDSGYWQATYSAPSAQFNKPWVTSTEPGIQDLTRSITFVQDTEGTVEITARVANYSLVETDAILVSFYQGDPMQPGAIALGTQTIDTLPAGGRTNVTIPWTPPATGGPFPIYAALTPNGGSDFSYVQGYAIWPPTTELPGGQVSSV